MANSVRIDPYRGFNFRVELDNTAVASFRDYREGTDRQNSVRKLPAMSKNGNVGLKRGVTQSPDL